jgi:thiol-disulfide isomerase/thioredoxin
MLSTPSIKRILQYTVLFALVLFSTPAFSSSSAQNTLLELYPRMSLGVLRFARLSELPQGKVLKADDVVIQESLLLRRVEKEDPQFRDELKKNLIYLLEEEMTKKLLLAEAYWSGYSKEVPEDQTISSFKNSKIPAFIVSDEETRAFYDKNSDWLGNHPFEQVADAVKEYLLDQKREEAFQAYLLDLASTKSIEIQGSWAKENCALAGDNPVDRARNSGKPTVVDFGATGCTTCDMMRPILLNLEKLLYGKTNVVFVHIRHFPFLASRYKVSTIPVQVFFDKTGKEVFRHVGFYPQSEIEKRLAEIGEN